MTGLVSGSIADLDEVHELEWHVGERIRGGWLWNLQNVALESEPMRGARLPLCYPLARRCDPVYRVVLREVVRIFVFRIRGVSRRKVSRRRGSQRSASPKPGGFTAIHVARTLLYLGVNGVRKTRIDQSVCRHNP